MTLGTAYVVGATFPTSSSSYLSVVDIDTQSVVTTLATPYKYPATAYVSPNGNYVGVYMTGNGVEADAGVALLNTTTNTFDWWIAASALGLPSVPLDLAGIVVTDQYTYVYSTPSAAAFANPTDSFSWAVVVIDNATGSLSTQIPFPSSVYLSNYAMWLGGPTATTDNRYIYGIYCSTHAYQNTIFVVDTLTNTMVDNYTPPGQIDPYTIFAANFASSPDSAFVYAMSYNFVGDPVKINQIPAGSATFNYTFSLSHLTNSNQSGLSNDGALLFVPGYNPPYGIAVVDTASATAAELTMTPPTQYDTGGNQVPSFVVQPNPAVNYSMVLNNPGYLYGTNALVFDNSGAYYTSTPTSVSGGVLGAYTTDGAQVVLGDIVGNYATFYDTATWSYQGCVTLSARPAWIATRNPYTVPPYAATGELNVSVEERADGYTPSLDYLGVGDLTTTVTASAFGKASTSQSIVMIV